MRSRSYRFLLHLVVTIPIMVLVMTEMNWTTWNDARVEARLRELMSDLATKVEAGEITSAEANALYTRTADRWMYES